MDPAQGPPWPLVTGLLDAPKPCRMPAPVVLGGYSGWSQTLTEAVSPEGWARHQPFTPGGGQRWDLRTCISGAAAYPVPGPLLRTEAVTAGGGQSVTPPLHAGFGSSRAHVRKRQDRWNSL